MLEGTIETINAYGEIAANLADSTGTILVTLVTVWVVYSLCKSLFGGLKSVFKEKK